MGGGEELSDTLNSSDSRGRVIPGGEHGLSFVRVLGTHLALG